MASNEIAAVRLQSFQINIILNHEGVAVNNCRRRYDHYCFKEVFSKRRRIKIKKETKKTNWKWDSIPLNLEC